jgi:hypothetical protein
MLFVELLVIFDYTSSKREREKGRKGERDREEMRGRGL